MPFWLIITFILQRSSWRSSGGLLIQHMSHTLIKRNQTHLISCSTSPPLFHSFLLLNHTRWLPSIHAFSRLLLLTAKFKSQLPPCFPPSIPPSPPFLPTQGVSQWWVHSILTQLTATSNQHPHAHNGARSMMVKLGAYFIEQLRYLSLQKDVNPWWSWGKKNGI